MILDNRTEIPDKKIVFIDGRQSEFIEINVKNVKNTQICNTVFIIH